MNYARESVVGHKRHLWERRDLRLVSAVLGALLGARTAAWAGVNHADQAVTGVETWAARDNPHLVSGVVTVEKGATLRIEPGAIVYFIPDYRSGILVDGSLMATGSADVRIFLGTE